MRVLVTGGAGFIGSNLVWTLLSGGHEVGVIDDLSTGSFANMHPAAWSRTLDITGPDFAEAFASFAPEAVVHLAAQTSVTESLKNPERDRLVNVEGTRAVAHAALTAGVRRMISASSAAVYGEPAEVPLFETSLKRPINPYGESKLEAESALASVLRGTATDFASFRFANVYGPRQDWRGEGGVVAIFAARMNAGEAPVMYGSGQQTRDFIYVSDVVAAIVAALESETPLALEGDDGPAYNISTGTEKNLEELASALRLTVGYYGPIERAEAREGDIVRSALDPSKANAALGWAAHAEFETALGRTATWLAREQ